MTSPKITLHVCMGSACHQSGVYEVLEILQRLIVEYGLQDRLELKGAFCLGACLRTIVLKFEDQFFYNIKPGNVRKKFVKEVIARLGELER
ncbi:MAG: (2Fe-2S) ferredoxin domain-containing protein [Chloroflexota bacterium]